MNWTHSAFATAAGWAVLHSMWQGAAIALLLAIVLRAVADPRVRYWLGCGALVAVLGSFAVTLGRSMPDDARRVAGVAPVWGGALSDAADGGGLRGSVAFEVLMPWLSLLWIAGAFAFQIRQLIGWYAAGRLRRRGVCAVSDEWQRRLLRLSAELKVTRPVRMLESCLVEAPVVLGHFRPLILMPLGLLTGLPVAQIEAILLHELEHVRRCDYLVNAWQRLVEGLLFYHPAVWWISRLIRTEREHCCDDAAVAFSGDAHAYASALMELEASRQSRQWAVAATGGSLTMRIQRLLYPAPAAGGWTPLVSGLVLMLTAAAVLPGWQAKPDAEVTGAYQKWVDEDVVYIIQPEERAAYAKLSTNEERKKFIEQFWLRRDPTPGTPENEMKEEHYRRIAYSNERFAGWWTDRGRMYIVYGPPDEIESHPSGAAGKDPWEEWMFHHIEGIGDRVIVTFVKQGGGEYRMTVDPHGAKKN